MKRILLTLCLLASFGMLQAQGDHTFRLDRGVVKQEFIYTKDSYPECHASTIAETPGGLVAAWFGGTKERNPDVCIRVSRYENGKWTESQNVASGIQNDTLRYPTWNPVLYQVPGGELWLFYKVGPSPSAWWGMLTRSTDNGRTWSTPERLPEGFQGPVKNKPVMLSDGTILCPSSREGSGGWRIVMESTRDGKTWTKVELPRPEVDGTAISAIQPSVLDYGGGRLQIICRSQNRRLAEAWSEDNGKTWGPLGLSTLPANNSGTDAVTLTDGRQLLVYNHILDPDGKPKGPRTPLDVSVSKNGKTWYAAAVLEDSPISQYSYPAVIQTSDGLVHVVYTWRRQRIAHAVIDPDELRLKKIKGIDWPKSKK